MVNKAVVDAGITTKLLTVSLTSVSTQFIKGIVHFEIKFWYVLAYLKGIQDVFFSAVVSILIFLGQTVLVSQSDNAGLWSLSQRACTESKLKQFPIVQIKQFPIVSTH